MFSITNSEDHEYWSKGSYDDWLGEMAGARLIIERFANISGDGAGSVVGVRAPYLKVKIGSNPISGCPHTFTQVGGNEQFEMMTDQFFLYDSSIAAPLGRVPIWPYTLDYRCWQIYKVFVMK